MLCIEKSRFILIAYVLPSSALAFHIHIISLIFYFIAYFVSYPVFFILFFRNFRNFPNLTRIATANGHILHNLISLCLSMINWKAQWLLYSDIVDKLTNSNFNNEKKLTNRKLIFAQIEGIVDHVYVYCMYCSFTAVAISFCFYYIK